MLTAMMSELVLKYCQITELQKMYIDCLHDHIQFFVTFHRFTNPYNNKNTLNISLSVRTCFRSGRKTEIKEDNSFKLHLKVGKGLTSFNRANIWRCACFNLRHP